MVSGRKLFFLAVLVVLTLYVMRATAFGRTLTPPLESAFRDLLAPLEQVSTWLGRGVRDAFTYPVSLINTARREQDLAREVARLEGELRQANEYRLENERLKKLLDYRDGPAAGAGMQVTAAAVVGRDPGNWFSTLTLNKGSRDGLRENMTVLAPQGLVGRVIAVSDHTATVLLITDPRSGVSALIQDTRTPGLVEGTAGGAGLLHMIHIPNDQPVQKGQVVVTSGMSSIFVRGVPVGEITDVKRDPTGLFFEAGVKPFVDFNRLEEVLVVTAAAGG
ncbi:MAG TPA: rod shape-determining protein MreC [Desulfotomaculum sp.]|nr:rod shape-determining protein MreC [Desulfotomaculum sp.]